MALRKRIRIAKGEYLDSGSTMLNLSCTGNISKCYKKGHYYLVVGDSRAGKTWIAHVALAEASIDERFNDYSLLYWDIERGALMDVRYYFGKKMEERLEVRHADFLEEIYDQLDELLDKETPFVGVIDSMDALDTETDAAKVSKVRSARQKGKSGEQTGTYGTAKAKLNSARLRNITRRMEQQGSILLILCQSKDSLAPFEPRTRAGGRALQYYATLEMWLSIRKKIKRTIKGSERTIGVLSKVEIKKNRIQGKDRIAYVPIYYSAGMDDVGSCILFLASEKYWKGTDSKVSAPEFDYSGTAEGLIHKIEEEGLERSLRKLVGKVWNEIEEITHVSRKRKYD